jgi:hypothetical protein
MYRQPRTLRSLTSAMRAPGNRRDAVSRSLGFAAHSESTDGGVRSHERKQRHGKLFLLPSHDR